MPAPPPTQWEKDQGMTRGTAMPPSWKECPHCRQKFSASSLKIHVQRCRQRKDVQDAYWATKEKKFMENSAQWMGGKVSTWPHCSNCGEQYSPTSMAMHVKRCKRLRPKGKNTSAAATAADGPFNGLFGVDNRPLPQQMLEQLGNSLRSLVASDEAEACAPDDTGGAMTLDDDEKKRLRALFDKFDVDGNGALSQREHGMLLFQCFPERVLDAKELLAEFKTVDADGSGLVSFEEFLRYYGELLRPQATQHFDEAAAMFEFFDADFSGALHFEQMPWWK